MDTNDSRFDQLRRENMSHFEQGVSAFSDGMGLSIDRFYEGLSKVQQDMAFD
jgi:hypothetical protein